MMVLSPSYEFLIRYGREGYGRLKVFTWGWHIEENMIDKIVDARRRGRGKQCLVRWVRYDRDHDENGCH